MSDEEEYEVEQICEKRLQEGKVEHLVKWKGWDHKDSTWEPIDHLNCQVTVTTPSNSQTVTTNCLSI